MSVGIVIVGGILFGCGYRVTQVMISNQTYPPKSDSYQISVYSTTPERPYIVIAQIYAFPRNPIDVSIWSADSAIEALKKRAKELGADALVLKRVDTVPTGTMGQRAYSGEGYAIHWAE
jgi:hypothetical protein